MKKFGASLLNKRITLQQPVDVDDGQGGITRTWQDEDTFWIGIDEHRGREVTQDGRQQMITQYKIICRYRSDITNAKRLKFGTRFFNIRQIINPQEKNAMLTIIAEEGVAM